MDKRQAINNLTLWTEKMSLLVDPFYLNERMNEGQIDWVK